MCSINVFLNSHLSQFVLFSCVSTCHYPFSFSYLFQVHVREGGKEKEALVWAEDPFPSFSPQLWWANQQSDGEGFTWDHHQGMQVYQSPIWHEVRWETYIWSSEVKCFDLSVWDVDKEPLLMTLYPVHISWNTLSALEFANFWTVGIKWESVKTCWKQCFAIILHLVISFIMWQFNSYSVINTQLSLLNCCELLLLI